MNSLLNQDDLDYIKWLEGKLNNRAGFVVQTEKNTFLWTEKVYLFKEYGQKDYKKHIISSFIQDLTNGSKTYQYHIYDLADNICYDIVNVLLTPTNPSSHELKLRMLNLFEGDNRFFEKMLEFAYVKQDSNLMLSILDKKIEYHPIHKPSDDGSFSSVIFYYQRLIEMDNVNSEAVQKSFINHIKKSQLDINETNLIKTYLSIFSQEDLPKLLDAFNIDEEPVCLKIQEKCFSMMTLSVKKLAMADLSAMNIETIINQISISGLNFPKISYFEQDEKTISLLIQANKVNNEKKVLQLFEEIIANHYNYDLDKEQKFKTLLSLIEKVNLEYELSEESPIQKRKLKV